MKFWIFFLVLIFAVSFAFSQNLFAGLEMNSGGFLGIGGGGIGGGIDTPHAVIGASLMTAYGFTDIGVNFTNILGNLYNNDNFRVTYGWTALFDLATGYITVGVGGSLIEHWKIQNIPLLFRQTLSINTSLISMGAFYIGTDLGFYYEF
ncbi:MAG: hypothetical protein ACP5F2_05420 [Athalassotoga sp.]|uniref:hypothetical protein n=1 Tax=Athalassotoga sp. TaxID=2022597 RepID=UPI003CFCF28D